MLHRLIYSREPYGTDCKTNHHIQNYLCSHKYQHCAICSIVWLCDARSTIEKLLSYIKPKNTVCNKAQWGEAGYASCNIAGAPILSMQWDYSSGTGLIWQCNYFVCLHSLAIHTAWWWQYVKAKPRQYLGYLQNQSGSIPGNSIDYAK